MNGCGFFWSTAIGSIFDGDLEIAIDFQSIFASVDWREKERSTIRRSKKRTKEIQRIRMTIAAEWFIKVHRVIFVRRTGVAEQ